MVTHIIIGKEARTPLRTINCVEAVEGRGLKGDRYYYGQGSFNREMFDQNVRDVTLLSAESIMECNIRLKSDLSPEDFRRNIIVKGIDLKGLKKQRFQIGDAVFEYARTAPPCRYLSRLLEYDMMTGLKGIGGIRATIIKSGKICVGDTLQVLGG